MQNVKKVNFDTFMARVRAAKERPTEELTTAQIKLLNSLEVGLSISHSTKFSLSKSKGVVKVMRGKRKK